MMTPLRGVHVAVVGESAAALEALTQTLRYHGALVTMHDAARSLLRLMEIVVVSVVVVDLGEVTDVSLKVIRAIRALPRDRGGRVPIVALCAGAPDLEPRIVAEDVDSIARKPISGAQLAQTVATVYAVSSQRAQGEV
jgi:CheY-like chemotaxis protein